MTDPIKFFDREKPFFEFSNYYPSPFVIDGQTFLNNEHYYQAQKFNRPNNSPIEQEYYQLILAADSPQKTKDLANQRTNYRGDKWLINKNRPELGKMNQKIREYQSRVSIRSDWEQEKVNVMRTGLNAKFTQNPELAQLLLSTADKEIIENSPYDTFWGNAKNGQNMLGQLLMELRDNNL